MFKEFKKFITRGNVVDLAVGIIIGASFNKIVSTLVSDIITPIISFITSFASVTGFDLKDLRIILREASQDIEGSVDIAINIGSFVTDIIDFLITGFAVFLIVKAMNKLNEATSKLVKHEKDKENKEVTEESKEENKEPEPPAKISCPYCKSEISAEAVRCPFCTSVITELKDEKSADDSLQENQE